MATLAQQVAEMLGVSKDRAAAVLLETDGDPDFAVSILLEEGAS